MWTASELILALSKVDPDAIVYVTTEVDESNLPCACVYSADYDGSKIVIIEGEYAP